MAPRCDQAGLIVPHLRFVLLDDFGPIRQVATREEAKAPQETHPEWRLVVEPKQTIDLSALEDASF